MQKKTAVELGIIAVMAIALFFASLSLVQRKTPEKVRGASKGQSSGMLAKAPVGPVKSTAGIKIRHIKDDNFFVRLSRVADALPLDRDPFSFGGIGPRSSRDGLELTGILSEGDNPTAIIDDSFYKAGDSTDQFTVVRIQGDKVILKDSAGEFELRLKS